MKLTIEDLRSKQLARIKAAIRRDGPIGYRQAREVMAGGHPVREARFKNDTIQGFIAAGELIRFWDEEGNTLIGLL